MTRHVGKSDEGKNSLKGGIRQRKEQEEALLMVSWLVVPKSTGVFVCLGWLECDPAPIKANSGLCLSRAAETLGAVALWRRVVLGGQVS